MASRRSAPKVSAGAPTHDQLVPLVRAAANVADHGALRPWRLIELREGARDHLGRAMASAAGKHGKDGDKLAGKPLRADLLIAVVACRKPSHKVEIWEQDAAASGVAHILSLLLTEAGWGVMWRTGPFTRSAAVREVHRLDDNEQLLGWLYVGTPKKAGSERKSSFDVEQHLTQL
ncbi:nitroreductase family protein [Homoserinimonas sp. A447]